MTDIMGNIARLIEIEDLRRALEKETCDLVAVTSRKLNPVGKGMICCLSFMPKTKMGDDKRRQAKEYFDREYGQSAALPGINESSPAVTLPGM